MKKTELILAVLVVAIATVVAQSVYAGGHWDWRNDRDAEIARHQYQAEHSLMNHGYYYPDGHCAGVTGPGAVAGTIIGTGVGLLTHRWPLVIIGAGAGLIVGSEYDRCRQHWGCPAPCQPWQRAAPPAPAASPSPAAPPSRD